jgi:hypothetical protein
MAYVKLGASTAYNEKCWHFDDRASFAHEYYIPVLDAAQLF